MPITVHVEGVEGILKELRRVAPEAKEAIADVLWKEAIAIRDDAKNRCPKDTGALSESIRYTVSRKNLTASVIAGGKIANGRDVYYAGFVEYGTRKKKAQEFLMPAGRAHEQETMEALEAALHKVLEDSGNEL